MLLLVVNSVHKSVGGRTVQSSLADLRLGIIALRLGFNGPLPATSSRPHSDARVEEN